MANLKASFICATFMTALGFSSIAVAEDSIAVKVPENSVISDGKLTKEELAQYAVAGQQQLVHLIEEATKQYSETLTDDTPNMPAAWMLMDDGETVKRINIDDQAGEAPAQLRILMYRAALKSIARRGKVNAAAILYTGKVNEGSDEQALVIEHEHRLGISGNKVIPYEVKGGTVSYSRAVNSEKPFQMFYDEKPGAAGNHS
ncbi:hypothetical protein FWJ25_06960 [Marinobacter salinexigens]|uniref:Uncharacterized protein n=1 Tax=Marinobacter salinexigens TaxID=2919747 RepID=A0A5B0VK54_9GAMM|nr:hypothetical protein [Marinobacter salinexigens]KAA1175100.1 hypothetical protein FWJ25_06960 [Marinobacter salinexigens]